MLIVGVALIVASAAIPFVCSLLSAADVNGSIIGGADAPAFLFRYRQCVKPYFWVAITGLCLLIGSVVGRIVCKK